MSNEEVKEFSRKVQAFKQTEHWGIFEDKLQRDWKFWHRELRKRDAGMEEVRGAQAVLAYIKEVFDWYDARAIEEALLTEEEKRLAAENDF